jgi:hypothetical protein
MAHSRTQREREKLLGCVRHTPDSLARLEQKRSGTWAVEKSAIGIFHLTDSEATDPANGASELIALYQRQVMPVEKAARISCGGTTAVATAQVAGEGILRAAKGV